MNSEINRLRRARCHTCYTPPVVALRQRTGARAGVGQSGAGSAAGFMGVSAPVRRRVTEWEL